MASHQVGVWWSVFGGPCWGCVGVVKFSGQSHMNTGGCICSGFDTSRRGRMPGEVCIARLPAVIYLSVLSVDSQCDRPLQVQHTDLPTTASSVTCLFRRSR